MNVLILGSGGREHALAWKIAQSTKLENLYIAPGNGGTRLMGKNVNLNISDFQKVKEFVLDNNVDMMVVGPEDPLVNGIIDFFKTDVDLKKIIAIGPSKQGAMLEGSKDFAKEFMHENNIPTAKYKSFTGNTIDQAFEFMETLTPPYVLKADGLAAGKGVVILNNIEEAKNSLTEMLSGKFGEASKKVVIEEFLKGIELSVFVITDGKHYKILPEAKDYKKIGEGDTGLNTGGMGAVSPVPFAKKEFMSKVEERIIKPTIEAIQKKGIDYTGFIFFGLMNVNGDPFVIEYNVRMGDPETEVVLPRIKNDFLELLYHAGKGKLEQAKTEIDNRFATTVMVVSGGYPQQYKKNKKISGLNQKTESIVFHAGTQFAGENYVTSGGRVLSITSYGDTIDKALLKSYETASKINFEGKYYRKDIGFDLK